MTHPLNDETRNTYDFVIEYYSKWIHENEDIYVIHRHEHNIKTNLDTIITNFYQAMRPQEDN